MSSFDSDSVVNFGEEAESQRLLRHPIAVIFHLAFKILAVLTYWFCEMFVGNFIISFLTITFFLALDFWTVKNVTGRLLAGLRWWNFVDNDGQSHWKFESRKGTAKDNIHEARIFWLATVLCPGLWALFIFVTFFTFNWKWLIINILGLGMTGTNLYCYLRCRWNTRQEASSYISQSITKSLLGRLLTGEQAAAKPAQSGTT